MAKRDMCVHLLNRMDAAQASLDLHPLACVRGAPTSRQQEEHAHETGLSGSSVQQCCRGQSSHQMGASVR